jgi:hypothetical protein
LQKVSAATPLARTAEFIETNQCDLGSPVLFAKIFRFTRRANHLYALYGRKINARLGRIAPRGREVMSEIGLAV